MDRGLALFAIGLVFGGGAGFLIAAGYGVTLDGHDHADPTALSATGHDMAHDAPLEVPAVDAPEVSVLLTPDPMSGYNLNIKTRNFEFAPRQAGLADVAGQGHAHVYANGVKLGRVYGPWMHIAKLPGGEVTVEVTLNSNDHRPLAVAGQPISASTRLIVE